MKVDKLILQMSFLDENLGRLFLSSTALRETTKATIDLSDLQKRMQQFDDYIEWFFNNDDHNNTNYEFIKTEAKWSLQQVVKFLKLLEPPKDNAENAYEIQNPRETLQICLYYKDILERLIARVNNF